MIFGEKVHHVTVTLEGDEVSLLLNALHDAQQYRETLAMKFDHDSRVPHMKASKEPNERISGEHKAQQGRYWKLKDDLGRAFIG